MKTLTKILICVFVFTLGTSSSNPKGQTTKPKFDIKAYSLNFDKAKLCSKDNQIKSSLESLEKEHKRLICLKKEVKMLIRDSTQIALKQ